MKTREAELQTEVDRWLEAAEAADAQEDKLHGATRRGDETPEWIANKQKRLAKIHEAEQALEAEAAAAAAAKAEAERAAEEKRKIGGELTQKMREKLKRAGHRSRYRLRKQIVEPAFGQINQARGFRQFLLRGLEAVRAEWAPICTAHNIKKLAKAI